MLSWVMASRNDGYGGSADGVENPTVKRLNIAISSILAMNRGDEIIVVEFCPYPDKQRLSELVPFPVRIITVDYRLLEDLKKDNPKAGMEFYEYVAKDIGIRKASNEFIIACNPDNVFPQTNIEEVESDLGKGLIVLANRHEIDRSVLKLDAPTLIRMANNEEFEVVRTFTTAAGDFTAFSRGQYEKIGGYSLMHGDWHMDNDFINKAILLSIERSRPYSHYHISHDDTIYAERKNHDWEHFKPIDKTILEKIAEYAKEGSL